MTGRRIAVIALGAGAVLLGNAAARSGYLAPGAVDILSILPPAPTAGDARDKADRAIFRQTRRFVGSERYRLATADASEAPEAMMAAFSCAAGLTLTPATAPATVALLERASTDVAAQNDVAKAVYRRRRPFLQDRGEVCQAKPPSYDYPSGHTARGWTWALVLSDLLPDRVTPILARGRAYGESRFICGVHNESAVEAGRLSATATMQAVRATPAFHADEERARAELVRLKATAAPVNEGRCDAERRLIAQDGLRGYRH